MEQSPNLALPYIVPQQAQKHITHNEAIRALDALVQASVLNRSLSVPPEAAQNGDRYIVASGGSGAWLGQDDRLAAFQDGVWVYYAPAPGWLVHDNGTGELVVYGETGWTLASFAVPPVLSLERLAVNTSVDAVNQLSVHGGSTLLAAASDDHRLMVSKAGVDDTASLVLQDAFSGRAEIGLTGDDDLHIKVSADGHSWTDALVINSASGEVQMPASTFANFTPFAARSKVTLQAAFNVPNATLTRIDFTTEDYDTAGFFTPTASGRFTVPTGISAILIYGFVQFAAALGTNNFIQLLHLDSTGIQKSGPYPFPLGGGTYGAVATSPISVGAGDYLELHVYQNSGSTKALYSDGRVYLAISAIA